MNLGKMDHYVALQAPAPAAQDSFGQPAPAAWLPAVEVWAAGKYPTGTEACEAAQRTAQQPVSFVIRHRADVRPTWRVLMDGATFDITAVAEIGRRHGLTLTALRRG